MLPVHTRIFTLGNAIFSKFMTLTSWPWCFSWEQTWTMTTLELARHDNIGFTRLLREYWPTVLTSLCWCFAGGLAWTPTLKYRNYWTHLWRAIKWRSDQRGDTRTLDTWKPMGTARQRTAHQKQGNQSTNVTNSQCVAVGLTSEWLIGSSIKF